MHSRKQNSYLLRQFKKKAVHLGVNEALKKENISDLISNLSKFNKYFANQRVNVRKKLRLTELPYELLLHIISYLEPADLLSIALVSSCLYQLSHDDVIWTRFLIEGIKLETNNLIFNKNNFNIFFKHPILRKSKYYPKFQLEPVMHLIRFRPYKSNLPEFTQPVSQMESINETKEKVEKFIGLEIGELSYGYGDYLKDQIRLNSFVSVENPTDPFALENAFEECEENSFYRKAVWISFKK